MSLAAYARNLYAPQLFVDVSVVTIVVNVNGRDATRSSPNTTAVDAAGTVACTMPSGQKQILLSANMVNAGTDKVSVTALASTGGVTSFTATATGGAVSGTREMHLVFLVINQ